ncbi:MULTISPECIES: substrate-binding domain-containing protein [Rhodopseudomonas]|uniref:PBP domain-containing protein n=1 Tax=Rhodopseudomonas palustris TaxID=1076 RepID=A0A0D7EFF5_RHOPL|nr:MULTISPECIES: substrate-binding domain-containing protein [Rhodopseudomonas]KIZ39549.1 hypothetical protein OO17_20120 [Rhodopseudomonas palustris]MDF3808953.1 substrate-binding domain-containing protein [Rhodopseudomonas sp. BAL398]WOK20047.1 substrate-binding domain-containing protein [Rhodopseudomonas sp. BAL398]
MSGSDTRRGGADPSRPSGWLAGLIASAMLLGLAASEARAVTLRTGGTGAAIGMLERLGTAFTARNPDITLEVIPGLGSSGSIAAVVDGALDFAVAGRALKPEEAGKALTSTLMARTPFGLVSSHPAPGNIASRDVAALFVNPSATWPDGTRVRVILRPKSEADTANLGAAFPGMAAAIVALRDRHELPVATTDQDNVRIAAQIEGSLTAVSLSQMVTEAPDLHFLSIDGVEPTLENLRRGDYPFVKNFTIVFPARRSAALDRFVAFLRSPEGAMVLNASGSLAVQP